ncbi:MAG: nitroreductase family protein [Dehalococcoidales bacterium]|jgi:nitroreductase
MEYMDVINKRRSIRQFKDTPIPKIIVDAIIESARVAPSGGNGQGWLFGVVTDKAIIKKLAQAAGNQTWITTAPLVIALCADISWTLAGAAEDDHGLAVNRIRFTPELIEYLKKYPDQRAVATVLENADTIIGGEHIALTVVNYGLSACWIGLLDIRKASKILNLPEKYACLFLMPVGYADQEPRQITRKAVEEIAFKDSYEKKYRYTGKKTTR